MSVKKTPQEIAEQRRQAIVTRFRGPTNVRGSRIIASCEAGRIMVDCDDRLDIAENHAAAAAMLADKMGWRERDELACGGTKDGYVFVLVPRERLSSPSGG